MTEVDISYLTGTSGNIPTVKDSAQDITQLRSITGLNVESSQQSTVQSQQSITYRLTATLLGNVPDSVRLTSRGTKTGWTSVLYKADGVTVLPNANYVDPSTPFEFTLKVTAPQVSIIGREAMDTTSNRDSTIISGNVIFKRGIADSLIFSDSVNLVTSVVPGLEIHNFASPFKAVRGTRFIFSVPKPGKVDLVVYNRLGEEIARLFENNTVTSGIHIKPWDGRNATNKQVAPGVYIYVFKFRPDGENTENIIKKKTAVMP